MFYASLLNSPPMGFHAPAQIMRDAREHGIEVFGGDISHYHWSNTLKGAMEVCLFKPNKLVAKLLEIGRR